MHACSPLRSFSEARPVGKVKYRNFKAGFLTQRTRGTQRNNCVPSREPRITFVFHVPACSQGKLLYGRHATIPILQSTLSLVPSPKKLLRMFKNYFKIAVRNLLKNKGYSFINIAGLATGMAVALLIGLWTWDELAYNRYHQNYDRIAQVWQHNVYNGNIGSQIANPYPMAEE